MLLSLAAVVAYPQSHVTNVPPAVSYTDASGTTSAGVWLLVASPKPYRRGIRAWNLGSQFDYVTYTDTSSPPTGTPSTTSNSTPGAEPIGPGGGLTPDSPGVSAGYVWIYCASAQPFTYKDF